MSTSTATRGLWKLLLIPAASGVMIAGSAVVLALADRLVLPHLPTLIIALGA